MNKKMTKLKDVQKSLGGPSTTLLLVSILLGFTPLRIVSLFILLFLFARLFKFLNSPLTQVILGGLSVMALTSIVAVLAWLINLPLSSAIILVCLAVIWKGLALVIPRADEQKDGQYVLFDDLVSLGVAGVICFVFMMPILQSPTAATLGQLVLFNGDNSTHIEIVKANDLNRGNAYGMTNRVNGFVDTASYPQGWHFFVAFLKWLTEPLVNYTASPGKILLLFYATAVTWMGALCFLIVRMSIWLGRKISGSVKRAPAIGSLILIVPVLIGWIFTMFSYGFETQIAALVFLLAELFVLGYALSQPVNKRATALRFALLFAVTVSFMWIFLTPVSVAVLACVYIATAIKEKKVHLWDVLLVLVLGSLVLMQFSFRVLFPLSHIEGGDSFINSNGLVAKSDLTWLAVASFVVFSLWLIKKTVAVIPTLVATFLGLLFSGGVLLYQYQTVGEARYFFFKANLMLIVLLAILGGAFLVWLLDALITSGPKKGLGKRSVYAGFAALVLALVIGYQVQSPLVEKYFNKTAFGMERRQADAVLDIVSKDQSAGYRVIAIGSCNRGDDIRATQLAWLISFQPLPEKGLFEPLNMFTHNQEELYEKIAGRQKRSGNNLIIVANDQVIGKNFSNYVGGSKAFEIVDIDTDTVSQTAEECPDRIRSFPDTVIAPSN